MVVPARTLSYYGAMKTRAAIAEIAPYVPGERRADALKLSSNENPLGCSPAVRAALANAADELHIYPDGGARELTAALAAHHGIDARQIMTGNGSDELLTLIAATYIEPGDPVLIGAHTFSQYEYATRLFGGTVVRVPMPRFAMEPARFADAAHELSQAGTPPRIIFLCTPNNPTGMVFSRSELVALLKRVGEDTLVVVDHAYSEYQDNASADAPVLADTLVSHHPNLIVLHTFSKIHGIAALRLGYGIMDIERNVEISRVRPPFSVNRFAQVAGVAALGDHAFVDHTLAVNRRGMARMQAICDQLGFAWFPSHANFLTFEVPMAARDAAAFIAQRGITVRALTSFGMPRHLRVTIGDTHHIDQLEPVLQELARTYSS